MVEEEEGSEGVVEEVAVEAEEEDASLTRDHRRKLFLSVHFLMPARRISW